MFLEFFSRKLCGLAHLVHIFKITSASKNIITSPSLLTSSISVSMSDSDSDDDSIDSIGNRCYDLDFDDDGDDLGDIQAILQAHRQTRSIKYRHRRISSIFLPRRIKK